MTRYLTVADAIFFHQVLIDRYGGSHGIRDQVALESLIQNHPFIDGNKRVAFAVADVFLNLNGYRIAADSRSIFSTLMTLFDEKSLGMDRLVPWLSTIVEPKRRP